MLQINGKTFMNLQEAVQWLLDNNALPFQSTANYAGNTEIGMGTIVNPSPAKVRIGSLIFFADSKVSTVIGLTENGFICSDQYNDLVDDVVYVFNVQLNASGHLIVTLSNGDTIDAGLIKQVTGFSIDASQHLIVSFNDGTSTDLGAIFNGDVNIAGNFSANSIIENMVGYSYSNSGLSSYITMAYCGVVKNGNKITFAMAGNIKRTDGDITAGTLLQLGNFTIPSAIGAKLFPLLVGETPLDVKTLSVGLTYSSQKKVFFRTTKYSNTVLIPQCFPLEDLLQNNDYPFRYEVTFLLSENLAS